MRLLHVGVTSSSVLIQGALWWQFRPNNEENDMKYTIVVALQPGVRRDDLHELDLDVAGTYPVEADNEEMALDIFHSTIPIKMLEDFWIVAGPSRPAPWSDEENAACVALYFAMLDRAIAGKPYIKAAMVRDAQQHESDDGGPSYPGPLVDRSRPSIEMKLMNCSAAHASLIDGAETMDGHGYRAMPNYQASLREAMAAYICGISSGWLEDREQRA